MSERQHRPLYQIRIESDGTYAGTVVYDEHGNKMQSVIDCRINIKHPDGPRAELTIASPRIHITSPVDHVTMTT